MNDRELNATAIQIRNAFSAIRNDWKPFVMHLWNLEEDSPLWHTLSSRLIDFHKLPIRRCNGDITNYYPKENLIYLSPDAETVLGELEPNTGYIIGAIVDKREKLPLTLAKAKSMNIRSARLPLDRMVKFKTHKSLCIDHVTKILTDMKNTNNWEKALLSNIPKRKLL